MDNHRSWARRIYGRRRRDQPCDTTQARHEGEIDDMACDFIATVLDVPAGDVRINRLGSA